MTNILAAVGFMVFVGGITLGVSGFVIAAILLFLWCWGAAETAGDQIADAVRRAMRP